MPRNTVRSVRRSAKSHGLDRHWLRSLGFTLILVGLVAAAGGANWIATLASLAICAVGFGFFYLVFPGGMHFGMTVANFLAVYACLFAFFRDANFNLASSGISVLALSLPVFSFLAGCLFQRIQVSAILDDNRIRELDHLPRLMRWFIFTLSVGAASFALPGLALDAPVQGLALLAAMATISAFVVTGVRDVVLLMVDIALIFRGVSVRLNRLVVPIMAFLTFYSLLVVIFGCLYRIAELSTGLPQFMVNGRPGNITFPEALYFSVITISTLGYGDFVPTTPLVRALAGMEVVCGVLMLLFGFSEIMRDSGRDSGRDPGLRHAAHPAPDADAPAHRQAAPREHPPERHD